MYSEISKCEAKNRRVFEKCKTNLKFLDFNTCINMSYLTESYIVFTLKMESVSKNAIFGLKMMVKSGLEKFILKSLHAGR